MKFAIYAAVMSAVAFQGVLAIGQTPVAADDPQRPHILLVHGAFAESSSWNGVIPKLEAQGYDVVAVANPLRGLRSDAEYVAKVVESIKGPVVLVGHSYGGSVITNAASGQPNVKALVYIDGTAPDVGESTAALSARFPGGTLGPTLTPPVPLPDGNKDLYIMKEKYHAQFAADVPEAEAKLMYATQRPVTEAALDEPAGNPAWKTIPSWFIYGSLDKNIPPAAHAFMAKRVGAVETIEVEGASHVVMVSHPEEVAQLIDRAARAASKAAAVGRDSPSLPIVFADKIPAGDTAFAPAPVVPLAMEPQARLIVDAPLPEQLARGYVVIRYRADNLRILPVYGTSADAILPRIGHLHVTVDHLPWHWLDASGEPLSINGLPPGKHNVLFELESPTHKVIDTKTVDFVIPQRQ